MNSETMLKFVIAKELSSSLSFNKALQVLLKNKNWKKIIQDVLTKKTDEKDAKLTDALLIAAVMALTTFFRVSTAEDLIDKIEMHVEDQKDTLVNKLETIIPYPVSKTELTMLKKTNPFTDKPLVNIEFFEKSLKQKVRDVLKKVVAAPDVKENLVLQAMPKEDFANLLFEGFKQKLEKTEYKDAVDTLDSYLQKNKKNTDFVYSIVKDEIKAFVR